MNPSCMLKRGRIRLLNISQSFTNFMEHGIGSSNFVLILFYAEAEFTEDRFMLWELDVILDVLLAVHYFK